MRGSLKQRSKGSWSIILDLGYVTDPATGLKKRQQKWHTFHGNKKQADDQLADLLKTVKDGAYVDVSKMTLAEWLREWLAASKKRFRPSTYKRYLGIIDADLAPSAIGLTLIQKVRPIDLETYYANATLSATTMTIHHTILRQAFRKATKDRHLAVNPAIDLDHKPRRIAGRRSEDAQKHCWNAQEARSFLAAAIVMGQRQGAFYGLGLDSGARKGELCGLTWANLDLDAGKMRIVQQLLKPGRDPEFGPTKSGRPRTVSLSAETVALLRTHRQHQRELMMANRRTYRDLDLVFAKEYSDLHCQGEMLGYPLQANNLGEREYAKIIKAAGVKRIKFHGLRHTCATLLLRARTPVHVVAERLGHAQVSMTMEIYAHVLPDMQTEAATTIGAILHG
jgi:integrase